MCLAIPGRVDEIFEKDGLKMAKVNFGGISKSACIEYTPDVELGSYVLVHVGFAISVINEEEAKNTFDLLKLSEEFSEIS